MECRFYKIRGIFQGFGSSMSLRQDGGEGEVVKKAESPNTTLNMLVSLDGLEYYNLIDGATNTLQFLRFFEEAGNCVNLQTGRPCLQVGDIIVMDNLSAHHYEGGEILEVWLEEMGIELIYLPTYSPDLNPIEFCFN